MQSNIGGQNKSSLMPIVGRVRNETTASSGVVIKLWYSQEQGGGGPWEVFDTQSPKN